MVALGDRVEPVDGPVEGGFELRPTEVLEGTLVVPLSERT